MLLSSPYLANHLYPCLTEDRQEHRNPRFAYHTGTPSHPSLVAGAARTALCGQSQTRNPRQGLQASCVFLAPVASVKHLPTNDKLLAGLCGPYLPPRQYQVRQTDSCWSSDFSAASLFRERKMIITWLSISRTMSRQLETAEKAT